MTPLVEYRFYQRSDSYRGDKVTVDLREVAAVEQSFAAAATGYPEQWRATLVLRNGRVIHTDEPYDQVVADWKRANGLNGTPVNTTVKLLR